MLVSIPASILLDGRQHSWSRYSIAGQKELFAQEGRAKQEDGWHVMPGGVDPICYVLLGFLLLSLALLYLFNYLIP